MLLLSEWCCDDGAVLLILLAVECCTILRIGRLLTLHVFLGMLLTACVFGSGIMLAVTGPSYGPPSGWLLFMVIHVFAYVPRLPGLLADEARGTGRHTHRAIEVLGGRATRLTLRQGRQEIFR